MEQNPLPQAVPPAAALLGDQLTGDMPFDEDDIDPVHFNAVWEQPIDLVSLGTAHKKRPWHVAIRQRFIRRILGLNPFKTSYFDLYRPLKDWQSRTILWLGVILAIAAGAPIPLIGVVLSKIIDQFPPPEEDLNHRLVQLMGIAVFYFAVTYGWSVCWAITGERVSRRTREDLLERALGLDMAYFDTSAPDMTNILTEKTQTIQLGTSEKVGLFIASISYFIAAFTVGFSLNAKLTGVMFATVIPTMAMVVIFGTNTVSKFAKDAAAFTEKASSIAESAIRAVLIVQAFGVTEHLVTDHNNLLRKALRAGIRKSIAGAMMLGSVWAIAYAANALAFWYGNQLRHEQGDEKGVAGTIYAVVFLILDASFVVGQFGPFIQTFALAAAAGEAVFLVMDQPKPEIDVYSHEGEEVTEDDFRKDIKFDKVSFVYPARPTVRVLDEVSLRFPTGKVTGVVGPSGSGKSTVTAMLLRFYDPTAGGVYLGTEDLRNFNVRSLRSHMKLVTQSPVLFTGTILDNIKQGLHRDQPYTEEDVLAQCLAAAQEAHCDFIENLPDGIHTKIGGGHHSRLSGGQKQRIALARALVGNPSLLLLDEFTSAMDATSEAIVLENLKRSSEASGRTTIIIAHRLVTVRDADHILVMKEGGVVEEGQHESLIKANGIYADLIRAQQFEKKPTLSHKSSFVSTGSSLKKENNAKSVTHETASDTLPLLPGERKRLSTSRIIARCFGLSRREAPAIGLGLFSSMMSGGIIVGEALIFGALVELLNTPTGTDTLDARVEYYASLFAILALIALFAHTSAGSAFGYVSENLTVRIRDISLRTILKQDIAWFSKPGHSHHQLMSRLNMDSGHISGLSGVIIGTFVSITTSVVGGIILAHIMAWKIAIVLLCAVPVMVIAGFFRLRMLAKSEERHQTAYNDAAALASEACASIKTVAALGTERDVLWAYRRAVQKPYQDSVKFSALASMLLAASLSISYFVYALAYWW